MSTLNISLECMKRRVHRRPQANAGKRAKAKERMREEMTLRSTVRAGILQQFRYLAEHRGV